MQPTDPSAQSAVQETHNATSVGLCLNRAWYISAAGRSIYLHVYKVPWCIRTCDHIFPHPRPPDYFITSRIFKMFITTIDSNLYQKMSFLPQVHWYVFLKLNHRGKTWWPWRQWNCADMNMAVAFKPQLHKFDQPWNLWLIPLHITCLTHHPGNGEMNLAVATDLQLHTGDPETCGLEIISIGLLGEYILFAMNVRWQVTNIIHILVAIGIWQMCGDT